jgi:hypothetical protein
MTPLTRDRALRTFCILTPLAPCPSAGPGGGSRWLDISGRLLRCMGWMSAFAGGFIFRSSGAERADALRGFTTRSWAPNATADRSSKRASRPPFRLRKALRPRWQCRRSASSRWGRSVVNAKRGRRTVSIFLP